MADRANQVRGGEEAEEDVRNLLQVALRDGLWLVISFINLLQRGLDFISNSPLFDRAIQNRVNNLLSQSDVPPPVYSRNAPTSSSTMATLNDEPITEIFGGKYLSFSKAIKH